MDKNINTEQTTILTREQEGVQPSQNNRSNPVNHPSMPVLTNQMYEQMVFTNLEPVSPAEKKKGMDWRTGCLIGLSAVTIILAVSEAAIAISTSKINTRVKSLEEDRRYNLELVTGLEKEIKDVEEIARAATATEASTEPPTEEVTEIQTEEVTETPTEAPMEPATEEPPVLSSDLYSNEIQIDGILYTIPFANQSIAPYYSFTMADYGYENGYVVNPRDSVSTTIELKHEGMNENFHVYAGFGNYSEQILDIQECNINKIELNAATCDSFDGCPSVVLPAGITWGSHVEQIIEAYGEPTDSYVSEEGDTTLHYNTETPYVTREFRIHHEKGLDVISIKLY